MRTNRRGSGPAPEPRVGWRRTIRDIVWMLCGAGLGWFFYGIYRALSVR